MQSEVEEWRSLSDLIGVVVSRVTVIPEVQITTAVADR